MGRLASFRVALGVQVMGCITASWMPVLMRSSFAGACCAVPALRGLLECLPGLLGLLRARFDFLGLDVGGLLPEGTVAKKGSSWIWSRLSGPEAAYPAYAVLCVRERNSATGKASLPKWSAWIHLEKSLQYIGQTLNPHLAVHIYGQPLQPNMGQT